MGMLLYRGVISESLISMYTDRMDDTYHFFVEVEGQYCLIRADVCVMSCLGLIWAMCAMNIPDYEPTPVEAQAIEMAAFEMGCRDMNEIDFHVTTVDIVPRDEVERDKSIHLH